MSKNGLSTMTLAKEFLNCDVGDKIPTVSELNEKIGLARGTIQNSIKFLQLNGAIKLESKGHLGTYLINKNTLIFTISIVSLIVISFISLIFGSKILNITDIFDVIFNYSTSKYSFIIFEYKKCT